MKQHYCLGFALNNYHVLLIRKIKPEWQNGRLNGVGGKVKDNETAQSAMTREFQEETGIYAPQTEWEPISILEAPTYVVHVFARFGDFQEYQSTTDETLEEHSIIELPSSCLDNLHWLIPMCLDLSIQRPSHILLRK